MNKIEDGILLAGGSGTRLLPYTQYFQKHMIPLKNKFIIDYSLQSLTDLGVKNVTVILGGPHFDQIVKHLKNGHHLDIEINYIYQDSPLGIAHAINLAQKFVRNKFYVILGDNFFKEKLQAQNSDKSAQIFLANHTKLQNFGVVNFPSNTNQKISFDEKPKELKIGNNYALSGCYQFDLKYFDFFKKIQKSSRNEYEIVDIIKQYYDNDELSFNFIKGFWSDVGTHESLNLVNQELML